MNTEIPFYRQIVFELENKIMAGAFLPGQRFPSIRQLAAKYQVNPNTVQRAVRELKEAGFLITPRGRGTFVTDDADFLCQCRRKRGEEVVRACARQMEMLGYSRERMREEKSNHGQTE